MRFLTLCSLAGLMLAGCGGAASTGAGPVPLDGPVTVAVDGAQPTSEMQLQAAGGLSTQPRAITLKIDKIELLAETGAHPRLDTLELPLGDVNVPASALPPTGLELRDLTLRLPEPAEAEILHAQPDALELEAKAPLELAWSMVLPDGSLYPLGPARTAPLAIDVDVVQRGASSVVTVSARCDGTCWSIDGVAQLSDGSLYVEAPGEVTAR